MTPKEVHPEVDNEDAGGFTVDRTPSIFPPTRQETKSPLQQYACSDCGKQFSGSYFSQAAEEFAPHNNKTHLGHAHMNKIKEEKIKRSDH